MYSIPTLNARRGKQIQAVEVEKENNETKAQHEKNLEGIFHWKTTHDGRTAKGSLFNNVLSFTVLNSTGFPVL